MKKLFALVIALMLVCSCAFAQTQITVTGAGTAYVNAEVAIISVGVRITDADVREAQSRVNTAINTIRDSLLEFGVLPEDINTDRINIYPQYDYTNGETIVGCNAYSCLSVRTENMDNIGTIIDLALEAGANTLDSISFSAKDTTTAETESLTSAVADALAKAQIIAAAAGLEIKSIVSINEGYTYSMDSGSNAFFKTAAVEESAAFDADRATLVQAAKLAVSSEITAVFAAE